MKVFIQTSDFSIVKIENEIPVMSGNNYVDKIKVYYDANPTTARFYPTLNLLKPNNRKVGPITRDSDVTSDDPSEAVAYPLSYTDSDSNVWYYFEFTLSDVDGVIDVIGKYQVTITTNLLNSSSILIGQRNINVQLNVMAAVTLDNNNIIVYGDNADDVIRNFEETIYSTNGLVAKVAGLELGKADRNNLNQTITANKVIVNTIEAKDSNNSLYFNVNENGISAYSETFTFAKDSNTIPYFLGSDASLLITRGLGFPIIAAAGNEINLFNDVNHSNITLDSSGNITLLATNNGNINLNASNIVSSGSIKIGDYSVLDIRNIVDNLTSTSPTDVLSANQGPAITTLINNQIGIITLLGGTGNVDTETTGTLSSAHMQELQKKFVFVIMKDDYNWNGINYLPVVMFGDTNTTNNIIEFYSYSKLDRDDYGNQYIPLKQYKLSVNKISGAWTLRRITKDFYYKATIDTKVSNLQSQIDGLNAGQNLADIVANLTALNNLSITNLNDGDKVQVLVDSNHDNASTVYSLSISGGSHSWTYIGKYGQDGYTKAEDDALLAQKQNVIDSTHKLSSDLVNDNNATNKFVTASDKTNWNNKADQTNTSQVITANEFRINHVTSQSGQFNAYNGLYSSYDDESITHKVANDERYNSSIWMKKSFIQNECKDITLDTETKVVQSTTSITANHSNSGTTTHEVSLSSLGFKYDNHEVVNDTNATSILFLTDAEMTTLLSEVFD